MVMTKADLKTCIEIEVGVPLKFESELRDQSCTGDGSKSTSSQNSSILLSYTFDVDDNIYT